MFMSEAPRHRPWSELWLATIQRGPHTSSHWSCSSVPVRSQCTKQGCHRLRLDPNTALQRWSRSLVKTPPLPFPPISTHLSYWIGNRRKLRPSIITYIKCTLRLSRVCNGEECPTCQLKWSSYTKGITNSCSPPAWKRLYRGHSFYDRYL